MGEKIYHISSGECFLIYPEKISFYQADESDPWTYYWVAFNGLNSLSYLTRAGFYEEKPVISCKNPENIVSCFVEMFNNSENQKSGDLLILSNLYNLLSVLINGNENQLVTNTYTKFYNVYITKVGDAHNPVSRTYCCKTDLNSCFLFVFYSNKLLKH